MRTEAEPGQTPGYVGYGYGPSPVHVEPMDTVRILVRYRRDVLLVCLLAILGAVAAIMLTQPMYRGVATLLIEPKTANIVNIDDVYAPESQSREYMKTQYEVLQSRDLAIRVVDKLKLIDHPVYKNELDGGSGWLGSVKDQLKALLRPDKPEDQSPEERRERLIAIFMSDTKVEPSPNTNLVRVGYQASDAALSAQVANALADAYIESQLDARVLVAEKATTWLTGRMEGVSQKLQESEKALQAFMEREQLVNVRGVRGLVEEDLTDTSSRMRDARRIRTELESVYRKTVQAGNNVAVLQEIPAIAGEALVISTKRSLLDAQVNIESLQSQYGPKHPKMIEASAALKEAQDAHAKQVLIAAQGIRSQYEVASATERSLSSVVEQSKTQIRGLDRKQYDLQVLQREVEANRELYDTLLTRFKEATEVSKLEVGNARIVDPAVAPAKPYKPRKGLILAAAAVAGLLLGIFVAFLRHLLDDTIQSSTTLEEITGLPVLAVLPLVNFPDRQGKKLVRIEIDDPKSAFAEGIRTVRTSILLSEVDTPRKCLLVTSSVPAEGKTTVASNLAVALGASERVLLIDADLRRPRVMEMLGLKPDMPGLSQLISGQTTIEQCIQRIELGNIDVLPAGIVPPNPYEMLSSRRFVVLMQALRERYDRILVDSAPCQAVSDALLLAGVVDGVIMLTRFESTSRRIVQDTVRKLQRAKAPLIGIVLNQFDSRKAYPYEAGPYYYETYYKT